MRMGLREANQQFSKAIRAVKAGQEVVLTERGKAIAVIRPFIEGEGRDAVIRRLRTAGFLRSALKATQLPGFSPKRVRGRPVAATLREDRERS